MVEAHQALSWAIAACFAMPVGKVLWQRWLSSLWKRMTQL